MCPASGLRKKRIAPLPVFAICCLMVLVILTGCLSGSLPGSTSTKSSIPSQSGSSSGNTVPAAYNTYPPATGSAGGSCSAGLMSCSGKCVDITTDSNNCEGCGYVCPPNSTCSSSQCHCKEGYGATADGSCVPSPSDLTPAQQSGGQWTCKDPALTACDDGNCYCGSCGNQCYEGQTCVNGACTGGAEQLPSPQLGGYCDVGTWCPNMCTNLNVDPRNCGACGTICTETQACVNGACKPTSCKNQAWSCSGHCALLNGDMPPLNCGGCGIACPSGQLCYSGICKDFTKEIPAGYHVCQKYSTCSQGNDDPCKDAGLGTFCGYDKTAADGGMWPFLICCKSGQTCVNGQCVAPTTGVTLAKGNPTVSLQTINPCAGQSGLTNCNGQCYNLKTDTYHCGSCTKSCTAPQVCFNGLCQCPLGQTLCGGICIDTNSNTANCGSCGNACASGKICSNGVCAGGVVATTRGLTL